MLTNVHTHLTEAQLKKLLQGDTEFRDSGTVAEHLESCAECRRAMESMAAAPDLWQQAADLSTLPHFKDVGQGERSANALEMTQDTVLAILDEPSHPDWLGSLGGYDVEREIGRGGMGIVLKAYDRELNRILAIKVMAPWLAQNGTARQRFAREARAAAAVIHPNVVPIYGINSNKGTPYLVMPFIAGPSLQRLIDEHGPLDEKEIIRMALQVSGALAAAHAQGLVHRDIKPANILVESAANRVLVTDFGLARAVDDASATQSGYFVGTPNYMSPEQALGRRVDQRSDLFSLGSVIYFMATGRVPFRADTPISVLNRIAHDEPMDVRGINCDISRDLSRIILALHEKDVEQRMQSAEELHHLLEQYLAYLHQPDILQPPVIPGGDAERQPEGENPQPARKRSRTVVLGMAAATIMATVGIAMAAGWRPIQVDWFPWAATSAQAQAPDQTGDHGADTSPGDATPHDPRNPADGSDAGSSSGGSSSGGSSSGGSSSGGSSSSGSSSGGAASDEPDPWLELIAEDGLPGTFVSVEREYAGQQIDGFTLYLPLSFSEEAGPYPVLMFLHGGLLVGGDISRVNQWDIPLEVKKHREASSQLASYLCDTFIIVCPHLVQGQFYLNEAATQEIIDEIQAKYHADGSRIYLTGLSRGGAGTWGLVSRMPGVFAAAAPIGGRLDGIEEMAPLRETPLWIAHNTRDQVTPYEPVATLARKLEHMDDGLFRRVDWADPASLGELEQPRVFSFRDSTDHNAWTEVYTSSHFYRWLLQQSLQGEEGKTAIDD